MNTLIEPEYQPSSTDLVAHYRSAPPDGGAFRDWLQKLSQTLLYGATSNHLPHMPRIFNIHQQNQSFSIAFPQQNFEPGNLPQNLAVVSNGFQYLNGHCLLEHIEWPTSLVAPLQGPHEGVSSIRQRCQIHDRPISAIHILPPYGLSSKEQLENAYHIWMGGCDMVIDHPQVTSLSNADFNERISFLSKEQQSCSKRTGQQKLLAINITAKSISEMQQRLEALRKENILWATYNINTIGLTGFSDLINTAHQLGMILLGQQMSNGIGITPQLRIGTPLTMEIFRLLGAEALQVPTSKHYLNSVEKLLRPFSDKQLHISRTFPALDVGDNLSRIQQYIKDAGHDLILIGNQTVFSHPDGVKAGASAFHSALEASAHGIDHQKAATQNQGLKKALEQEQRQTLNV